MTRDDRLALVAKAKELRSQGLKWSEIEPLTCINIAQFVQYYDNNPQGTGRKGMTRCECGELLSNRRYHCPACQRQTARGAGDVPRMTMEQLMAEKGFNRGQMYERRAIKKLPRGVKNGVCSTNRWWYVKTELYQWWEDTNEPS